MSIIKTHHGRSDFAPHTCLDCDPGAAGTLAIRSTTYHPRLKGDLRVPVSLEGVQGSPQRRKPLPHVTELLLPGLRDTETAQISGDLRQAISPGDRETLLSNPQSYLA